MTLELLCNISHVLLKPSGDFHAIELGVPFSMLAKVRASSFRRKFVVPFPVFLDRKHTGSVVILEDIVLSKRSTVDVPPKRKSSSRLPGSQYFLPEEYRSLLDLFKTGKINNANEKQDDKVDAQAPREKFHAETSTELSSPTEVVEFSRENRRAFWSQAKELSKKRVDRIKPDVSPAELRVAKLHESLWLEELRMNLELQHLTTSVSEIKALGNGLYRIDVTEVFDKFSESSHSFEQFLQRGVQIGLSSDNGGICFAFVQPGSDSGKLLVSTTAKLEETQGPYQIDFVPNRFPHRAMHQALDCARAQEVLGEVPESTTNEATNQNGPKAKNGSVPQSSLEFTEAGIPSVLNSAQRRALKTAMESRSPLPLIVWGPPGTGKSTLGAFLVWCLVQTNSRSQILVTAPSNTGADVLCGKLAKLGLDESRMLRLNALGRNVKTVPQDIQSYGSTVQRDGRFTFQIPELAKLRSFRVVVTTCICASHIANTARKEGATGWFSHVLVDEAGEATEPETLVPVQLASPTGEIILLGDHFQLGPLILSSLASRIAKLHESMIERLVNERFQASQERALNRDTLDVCESKGLFFLTESFRSHPDIMEMYSKAQPAGRLKG